MYFTRLRERSSVRMNTMLGRVGSADFRADSLARAEVGPLPTETASTETNATSATMSAATALRGCCFTRIAAKIPADFMIRAIWPCRSCKVARDAPVPGPSGEELIAVVTVQSQVDLERRVVCYQRQ